MIRFSCPQCKLVLQATDQSVGTITACPKCSKRMKVPEGPSKAKFDESKHVQRQTQHNFSIEKEMAGDWFYLKDKKKVGPVTMDDLKQMVAAGQLQPTDLVIKTGMQKWLPIHGFLDLLPPKRAAAKEWYFVRNKQKSGPVSLLDLKQLVGAGQLKAGDMLLKEGTQKWQPANSMSELFPAGGSAATVPPKPPPAAAPPKPAAPAVQPGRDWFYVRNKQKSGPVSLTEIKQMVGDGRLAPSDMVLRPGTQKWTTAEDVEELFGPAPVPPEVAKEAVDKGPAVPPPRRPAPPTATPGSLPPATASPPPSPARPPSSPAVTRPSAPSLPPTGHAPPASSPAVPRPSAPGPSGPAASAGSPPSAARSPASSTPPSIPTQPSAAARPAMPAGSSADSAVRPKPVSSIPLPTPQTPVPPLPEMEETPGPVEAITPREQPDEIDVEPVGDAERKSSKPKRHQAGKAKARVPGSNRWLRMLLAGWLGVVVFRTLAIVQYDPQLSLWLWPIEWLAGLAIAWMSFRRRIRAGVIVGLLGPTLVLASLAVFTAIGLGKEEGLEYLRWVMVPYGVIAVVLGVVAMQGSQRRKRRPKTPKASHKDKKKRRPSSSMRLRGRPMPLPEDDEDTEIGALGRSDELG